ncbi:hypothetical protein [Streptomyces sp. NPDC086519]|uniref:hypothetical protein n=1 Tax=Streptomyces sp. NPDC086519 TaxID=3154863 RepID=UPI00343545D0
MTVSTSGHLLSCFHEPSQGRSTAFRVAAAAPSSFPQPCAPPLQREDRQLLAEADGDFAEVCDRLPGQTA